MRGKAAAEGRIGFDVVSVSGEGGRGVLSRVGGKKRSGGAANSKPPTVGKYEVDVASFDRLASSSLSQEHCELSDVILVDEVGKMELFSDTFYPRVTALLDARAKAGGGKKKRPAGAVFGVIPMPRYGRFHPNPIEHHPLKPTSLASPVPSRPGKRPKKRSTRPKIDARK